MARVHEECGEIGEFNLAGNRIVLVFGEAGRVTARIAKTLFGDGDPSEWAYAVAVMSQEGFPSSGVMRVRDVVPEAEQWRIGGAPHGTTNHARVIDLVWPEEGLQESRLADFEPTSAAQAELIASDYARVPMFGVE